MASALLAAEAIAAFVLAAGLLFNYGDWRRQNYVVTAAVLLAWFFSLLIVFVLPLDVSSTVFRQCVEAAVNATGNGTLCAVPWGAVESAPLAAVWRVAYWSSQFLTWLLLPLLQSYARAGDFTVRSKLRSALVDNAIYYSLEAAACLLLLLYIAFTHGLSLDGGKLKAIASSASNTWGLLLLVLLLGHALVEVPRSLWRAACPHHSLHSAYFRLAKLHSERAEADEALDDALEHLQAVRVSVGPGHPLQTHVDTVALLVPAALHERMRRRAPPDAAPPDEPSERALVRLHAQLKRALQMQFRTEAQWTQLVARAARLEDAARFARPAPCWPPSAGYWAWRGKQFALRACAVLAAILSAAIVWSEATFFVHQPVLSLLALVFNAQRATYAYLSIELTATVVVAYLCFCAYSTVFKVRLLNLYQLAGHHATDEYSLIFSGMMLCRLTPAVCLNFLGLVHMDSHVIKQHVLETQYTQVMGHMDIVPIVADGFNVYFPSVLLLLCGATYLSLGQRLLSALGFHQFVSTDDDFTADLVDEGRQLLQREKRRRQRTQETTTRRRDFHERFGTSLSGRRQAPPAGDDSEGGTLLHDVEPPDYSAAPLEVAPALERPSMPPRGLFDDV